MERPARGGAPPVPAVRAHLAPAKVNLALHVTGRRPDGYHALSSLVAFADVGDRLTLEPAGADAFHCTGPFAAALSRSLPESGRNIVLQALDLAREVARLHGRDLEPLRVTLDKRLPVASGIGGGSADAAALLRLVSRADPALARPLLEASLKLGADVPMCVEARPALVSGIGEEILPLDGFPALPAVLVNPGVPVATPAVFARLQRRDNPPMPDLAARPDQEGLIDFLRRTRNDLEEPAVALAPAIAEAKRALEALGAVFSRMSGSGATVFGLFASGEAAAEAAAALSRRHPGWWCVSTRLGNAPQETDA